MVIDDRMDMNGLASERDLRASAAACLAAGLCVLPAKRDGDAKRVALRSWKPFQTRLPSTDEIEMWFGDASAMCLVCGEVSGNLEMIDFDLEGKAFEAWRSMVEDNLPGLIDRLVIETTPSGGRHVVYRSQVAVSGNVKLAHCRIPAESSEAVTFGAKSFSPRQDASGAWSATATLIETRGEGGLFLCAPSPGYEVVQGDLCEPPVLSADERELLLSCAWHFNEEPPELAPAPQPAPENITTFDVIDAPASSRPGEDFSARGDIRGVLMRHGWTLAKAGAPDENEHWRRPGKLVGTSATLKGGVLYVFSSNAAPFEPHKGYSPFAVYALLEHRGDFAAAARSLAAQGFGTGGTVNRTFGVDISGLLTGPEPASESNPAPMAVGELVASYPRLRPPVIHGLLREGETMNVIAAPKVGKSWLTIDLALSVATGRPWLGRYETVPGDVLILDNELHRETSAHRIPQVAAAREIELPEIAHRIFVDNLRGRLRDVNTLRPYFASFAPGRFKLIVLDAFYRFIPAGGDENDNAGMAGIYNQIDSFADRLGCCFVLIHHASKGDQAGKSVTDVGAGAGAQSRATDTHLVLRPHEEAGVVVLDAAARSWPPPQPTCLRWSFPVWNPDDSLDPTLLKGHRPSLRKRDAEAAPREPEWTIEQFVGRFIGDEPTTPQMLRQAASGLSGLTWRRIADLIVEAEQAGLIRAVVLSGRGAPKGYVRTDSNADSPS